MTYPSVEAYVSMRDRILETDNMAEFAAMIEHATGITPTPEVAEIAFHKARYEALRVSRDKRVASGEWLRAHKMGRVNMMDLLPPGQLPE